MDLKVVFGYGAAAQDKGGVGAEGMYDMKLLYEAHRDNNSKWSHFKSWKNDGSPSYYSIGASGIVGINYNALAQNDAHADDAQSISVTVLGLFGVTYNFGSDNIFVGLQPSASLGLGLVATGSIHYGYTYKFR